jgi:hypothetical protein
MHAHFNTPNVLVAHLQEGIEVVHLYTGARAQMWPCGRVADRQNGKRPSQAVSVAGAAGRSAFALGCAVGCQRQSSKGGDRAEPCLGVLSVFLSVLACR